MSFVAEWNAVFISGQSSYFPSNLVQRCVQAYLLVEAPLPEHQGMTFYLGCDWGRIAGADKTVLTVVGADGEGNGRVLWVKAFDGVDYVTQASYIAWLHGVWHFARVFSDASNNAVNDLLKTTGVPTDPIEFTAPGKVELFGRLKNSMEAGRLTIPNHPDLLRELSTFQYKISDRGNLLLHHVEGGHDDYPTALPSRPGASQIPWPSSNSFGSFGGGANLSDARSRMAFAVVFAFSGEGALGGPVTFRPSRLLRARPAGLP